MTSSRPIKVRLFAILREQAGCSTVEVDTTAGDATALYGELQRSYPGLTFPAHLLKASINERYATMDTPLQAGDRVVFIPPIAGG